MHKNHTDHLLPNEMWKDIPTLGGKYECSNMGRIRKKRNSIINPYRYFNFQITHHGYLSANPTKEYRRTVHRIVASLFIPNPNQYATVNHINGVKTDNRAENLEWASNKMNTAHAQSIGRLGSECWTILDLSTGIYYRSAALAAKELGIPYKNFVRKMKKYGSINNLIALEKTHKKILA